GEVQRGGEVEVTPAADVSRETSAEADAAADEELVPVPGATFAELPVEAIMPNRRQPRQVFDEDDISELATSIKEVGLLQPIVVRRVDDAGTEEVAAVPAQEAEDIEDSAGGEPDQAADGPTGADAQTATYELVMGERRLRAAKEAGLETIPAVVRYTADEELLRDALLENLHRVQLNPLEEAAAYQQLLEDFDCTQAELSEKIARSRSQISNTLRLMKLPPLVQRRVAAEVISAGHARALLGLPDAAAMERVAQRIVAEGLSVRATEEIVAVYGEMPDAVPSSAPARSRNTPLPALSTRLSDAFDTRVRVTRGAKKGRITIEFAGDEDLARIVEALAPGTSLDEG
ncbi:ParB/RepB/Spo0J family partition protein, partial [Actinomyces qiguomingii]